MAYTMQGTLRVYAPCQHPEYFTHRPDRKVGAEFIHPHLHKARWDHVWSVIKAQPWYEQDVSLICVSKDGYAYCQYPGLTTGLARVKVEANHG